MVQLVIELTEPVVARLQAEAEAEGVTLEEYVARRVAPAETNLSEKMIALFEEDFAHYRSVYDRLAQ